MKPESIFFKEWLATNRSPNQLPISAVCNSRCIFCSNYLNPFPIIKNIFREIEDIKRQLSLMSPRYAGPIMMSDSLPGRISEGEAFLHPELFKILELVRRRFLTNILCFTTNGSMLDEPFLKALACFRPIEITVAMHSTRPKLWARIFGRSESTARQAIRSLELIRKYHFGLIGAIVPLPAICGWNDIELTYSNFVLHGAISMILWWPGYTLRTPAEKRKDLECSLEAFTAFAYKMKARHKLPLIILPEMKASLNLPVKRIMALTQKGNIKTGGGPYRQVLWLASEAAAGRLANMIKAQAPSFPNRHSVAPVKNATYGGNIICAGLLMVNDFIKAGKQALHHWPAVELVLVPATSFDTLLMDLEGTPAYRIAEDLNKPVWVVSDDAGFNSLLGRGFLMAADASLDSLKRTMTIFNSAWRNEAQLEKIMDMIDSFPIQTSRGMFSRKRFGGFLRKEKSAFPPEGKPLHQRFELLDESRALCMEQWPTRDASVTFNKWTFLIKKGAQWKIERLTYGAKDDLVPKT